MKTKTKFTLIFSAVLAFTLIFVWYFGNFTLKTTVEDLTCDKAGEKIKIVLLSDLHSYSFGKDNSKLFKEIEEMEPDLIFTLGDLYSRNQTDKIPDTMNFLNRLSEIAEVYTVTGDHDDDDCYKEELRKNKNIKFLDYAYDDIEIKGNSIRIYGIDNVYFSSTFDLHNEFADLDKTKINILLSHIPSIEHYGDFGFDFIFCGDTHGGAVRLPWLGGLYFNGYILPKITYNGKITDKGLYNYENISLFVTSGLGNYPIPLRFNNRPEICLIKIKGE